jgi:hypothetical protein
MQFTLDKIRREYETEMLGIRVIKTNDRKTL